MAGGVNFMTDLKDLKDFGYVQQIPLEALFKNMGYKQQQYDQAFQKAQQVVDMVGSIPSLGQDTQKKQEIMDNVNKELSKFAGQDLREGNVQASLNGFIGQVLNGKDLQNMAARATKYTQDQKTYRELQKAGKSVPMWMQTSLNQANKYYGEGIYDPETRFTGEIQVAPDFTAKHASMMANLKPAQEMILGKDGYYHSTKGVSKERIAAEFYTNYTNDPELKEYYDKLFDATTEGTNWDDKVNELYQQQKEKITTAMRTETALYQSDQNPIHIKNIATYKTDLDNLESAKNSPNKVNFFKSTAKQDFLKKQALSDAAAKEYFESDIKLNEYDKINAEQRKDIAVLRAREAAERGLVYDPVTGGLKPMTYTDDVGNVVEVGGVGSKQSGSGKIATSPQERQFYTDTKAKEFEAIISSGKGARTVMMKMFPNSVNAYDNYITKPDGIYGVISGDNSVDPPVPASEERLITKEDYVAHSLKYLSDKDAQDYATYKKAEDLKNNTPGTTKPKVKI